MSVFGVKRASDEPFFPVLYNHARKATFQNSDLYHATDDTKLNSSGSSFGLRNQEIFSLIAQLTSTHT